MIRLILISLAGVRLQSKTDSHCESAFVFGLTPGTAIVVIMKITEGNLIFFIVLHKIIFVLTLFYRIDTFSKATNASSTRVMADLITSSSNVALRFTNNNEYANDWNPSGTCSPL